MVDNLGTEIVKTAEDVAARNPVAAIEDAVKVATDPEVMKLLSMLVSWAKRTSGDTAFDSVAVPEVK